MIISKIALNNYRLYQGVNEIEFKIKNGKNISENKTVILMYYEIRRIIKNIYRYWKLDL